MRPHVRRAVALVLLAVTLAVVCTFLGRWQWNRYVARDGQIRLIEDNYSAAAVPLDRLLAAPDQPLAGGDVWRRAAVTGHYETTATVLLRNRPIGGVAGYHVLVPFVVTDGGAPGAVLLVDRGWVPTGDNGIDVPPVPPAPTGTVAATVRLRPDEPASPRSAPLGQVQAISIAQVLAAGGATPTADPPSVYRAYGDLSWEVPSPSKALAALPAPSTDPGSHLSYAFQWWTFALGSLVGFTLMARGELRDRPGAGLVIRPERRRRAPSAEDEEDALVDAQLR